MSDKKEHAVSETKQEHEFSTAGQSHLIDPKDKAVHILLTSIRRALSSEPATVIFQTIVLLGVFLWMESHFFGARIGRGGYDDTSIFWTSITNSKILEVYFISAFIPLLALRQTSWTSLAPKTLRIVYTSIAVMLAFAFSAYDYNHFYDSWHMLDRVILIGLAALVWVHPVFAGPMMVLCIAMARQFETIGAYSWTDKRVVFQMVIAFVAFTTLRGLWRDRTRVTPVLVLCISIIGAGYVEPAFGKLEASWHFRDELHNLFVVSYLNHWWGTADQSTILWWGDLLGSLNFLLVWSTLIIELAPLAFFLNRRLAIAILSACVFFHVGIFLSSGIFFWKWIIVDLLFVWFLLRMKDDEAKKHFGLRNPAVWMSCVLMVYGLELFKPTSLWWYDTELSTSYELEAVTTSGKTYPLSRAFFSPYDIVFSQNRFSYLCKERIIHMTYGTTQIWAIAKALDAAKTKKDVLAIQRRYGRRTFNRRKTRRFDNFMRKFFGSINENGKKEFPGLFGSPHHIWNFDIPGDYKGKEQVKLIRVRLEQAFYRGKDIIPIQSKIIHRIRIPSSHKGTIKSQTLPLVQYRTKKDVAESAYPALSKRYAKQKYRRVGTLGYVFPTPDDVDSFLKKYRKDAHVFKAKRDAIPMQFLSRRGQQRDHFSSTVKSHLRNARKLHPKGVYLIGTAAAKHPSLRARVSPLYRYHHSKTRDNLLAVAKGDHQNARKGGYCLVCQWGTKHTRVCGSAIKAKIKRKTCAIGYVAKRGEPGSP